jgi:hypothetical protein
VIGGTDMTPMAESAAMLHEMFRSLIASGFTEWQACRIIGVLLAEQGRQE